MLGIRLVSVIQGLCCGIANLDWPKSAVSVWGAAAALTCWRPREVLKYWVCCPSLSPVSCHLRQFVGLEHAGHMPAPGILVLGSWDSPSSRTTRGTLSSSSRQALVIPLAMMAQLTIPPKILTRIASTWNAKQEGLIRIRAEQSQTTWLSNSWNS